MTFIFKDYGYDIKNKTAWFEYEHDNGHQFREEWKFNQVVDEYDETVLEKALFLAFILAGSSYHKCFPTPNIEFAKGAIDSWQADFLNTVYQEGMSQFAFENDLTRDNLAHFSGATNQTEQAVQYGGDGIISLQSGGKDSLLVAQLLEIADCPYTPWYVSSSTSYPAVLDQLNQQVAAAHRMIDTDALSRALADGGKNGHVPVTYIIQSFATVQAVLSGKNIVLAAIGHEGEEPHDWIGDLPVNHQWSKTWQAELLFAEYIQRYISPDIQVGSPLRSLSELKVAELFVANAWEKFGNSFSSCNKANYQQGVDNTQLTWCGHCPKCANSYLLFAPFVPKYELDTIIGEDLFANGELIDTFKGLLGIGGAMKPFECVGEVDELRAAYHLAISVGYTALSFDVPASNFNTELRYDSQSWAVAMIQ